MGKLIMEALERLYKSHEENFFAPFPTRSDLDTIRSALMELEEIKARAEEVISQANRDGYSSKQANYILKGDQR